jgi:hypothetical protein
VDNLDLFINASEMVTGLAKVRKIYDSFVEIAHDKTYSREERHEASELTKDGFYSFVSKVQKMDKE